MLKNYPYILKIHTYLWGEKMIPCLRFASKQHSKGNAVGNQMGYKLITVKIDDGYTWAY